MRTLVASAIALMSAAAISAPAAAQVYATSITASFPDPGGAVPGFNKVPGAQIENWRRVSRKAC
jgi:hypothetical protein